MTVIVGYSAAAFEARRRRQMQRRVMQAERQRQRRARQRQRLSRTKHDVPPAVQPDGAVIAMHGYRPHEAGSIVAGMLGAIQREGRCAR